MHDICIHKTRTYTWSNTVAKTSDDRHGILLPGRTLRDWHCHKDQKFPTQPRPTMLPRKNGVEGNMVGEWGKMGTPPCRTIVIFYRVPFGFQPNFIGINNRG